MQDPTDFNLAIDRTAEMDRYGRSPIYREMASLLNAERARVLDLVNHGLAMVDDVLDTRDAPLQDLERIRQLLQEAYLGAEPGVSGPEEKVIVDLGKSLNGLLTSDSTDQAIARHTYLEVLHYWDAEERNLRRRWEVLDGGTLEALTSDIGSTVASQLLFILDPPRDRYEFIPLVQAYGLAVKRADNLSDFRVDVQRGFVNVARENIHHVQGIQVTGNTVTHVDSDGLALSPEYKSYELERAESVFEAADRLLLMARLRRPVWDKKTDRKLDLFGQFCRTWLNQAKEVAALTA